MPSENRSTFIPSFLICITFIFLTLLHLLQHLVQCWIELVRYSCLILAFRWEIFDFSHLGILLPASFPWMLFCRWRKFSSISNLLRIIIILGNGTKRWKTEKKSGSRDCETEACFFVVAVTILSKQLSQIIWLNYMI